MAIQQNNTAYYNTPTPRQNPTCRADNPLKTQAIFTDIGYPSHGVSRRRIDLAGLLTDSCSEAFPILADQWLRCSDPTRSFTAAGLSGTCTRFPFHFRIPTGNGKPNLEQR